MLAKTLPTAAHFVKILGENETLHQSDVGTVLDVKREALRKHLAQTVVGGGRVLGHRGIRLQQDVDGRDRSIGGDCATGAEAKHGQRAPD